MNKEYIFWLILGIVFIAVLAVLSFFVLESVGKEDLPLGNSAKEESPQNYETNIEPESSGNQVIIQNSDPNSHLIYYRSGAFTPKEVRVENINGEGSCLITIFNDSEKELEIRLSPHKNEGDRGPHYDLIPSQGNLILDPRFRIPEIAFHNHNLPSAEFKVILGKGCVLD